MRKGLVQGRRRPVPSPTELNFALRRHAAQIASGDMRCVARKMLPCSVYESAPDFCDMLGRTANVRYWGEIGLNADIGL
jgi:hypothetical protein